MLTSETSKYYGSATSLLLNSKSKLDKFWKFFEVVSLFFFPNKLSLYGKTYVTNMTFH